jgi:hypothetical protein
LRTYAKIEALAYMLCLCLILACASTQLQGQVWTVDKEPAKNLKIVVKAEPGGKFAYVDKQNGSFLLKGLVPNTAYAITAICEEDNTKARVENVYINKGKNELQSNKMLILATHIEAPASADTSSPAEPGKGQAIPEKP